MASFTWITLLFATLPSVLCTETCDNKFEYEFGVLQKLEKLEKEKTHLATELNVQAYTNRALADQVSALTGQVTELLSENLFINKTLNGLLNGGNQHSSSSTGNTYIRWGRTSCPASSQLVYDGYAGGSSHTHAGGGANYLCLPKDPMAGEQASGDPRAYVYGAEYETVSTVLDNVYQHEVLCAVCLTSSTNLLMIPARTECYGGWTKEYSGYLMSEYYNYHRREYVCMDENPEAIGSSVSDNGALFYFVEAKCGSLFCPPYTDGSVLTCVMCSYSLNS